MRIVHLAEAREFPLWRRPTTLLVLMAIAMPLAFATWSALQRHVEQHGPAILEECRAAVATVWGDPGRKRRVTMDFYVRGWHHAT